MLSLLSCVTVLVGVALALRQRHDTRALSVGAGFSVALMILVSVFDLLPESISAIGAGAAFGTAGAGAALVWAAHFVIPHAHLVQERRGADAKLVAAAHLMAFGLILHDVPEGFAMANAYVASPGLGVLAALAIALHNVAEEFVMAVPLVMLRSRTSLYGAAFASALAEPAGAALGLATAAAWPSLNARFVALAAGAMLFISIHELVPLAKRYRQPRLFLGGAALSALIYAFLARVTYHLTPGERESPPGGAGSCRRSAWEGELPAGCAGQRDSPTIWPMRA